VAEIEAIARKHHVVVDMAAQDGCCGCVATLERIVRMGGHPLLDETLDLVTDVWSLRRESLDAAILSGIALILHHLYDDLDLERLTETLLETTPQQLKAAAAALKDTTRGTVATLHALAITARYDRRPGPKLRVTAVDLGGGARNARSRRVTFVERYAELAKLGYADWEIAKRMGIALGSLVRQMQRYDLPVDPTTASMVDEQRRHTKPTGDDHDQA